MPDALKFNVPVILNIYFGYEWKKERTEKDPKYQFLKRVTTVAAAAVSGMRGLNGERIHVNCSRLRARHGAPLLDVIRRRIQLADVLLFDLQELNPNVMFELGLALANPSEDRAVFILLPEGHSSPSDLAGYLLSFYRETDEYSLVDSQGFNAALRSAMIHCVRKKGVQLSWAKKKTPEIE
jgi:hypothetical protein